MTDIEPSSGPVRYQEISSFRRWGPRGTIWAWQRKTNLSNVLVFLELKISQNAFCHIINISENCYLFVLTEFSVITFAPGILFKHHVVIDWVTFLHKLLLRNWDISNHPHYALEEYSWSLWNSLRTYLIQLSSIFRCLI